MYSTAAELANTIVRNEGNQTIRIKYFARVELTSNETTTMENTNFIDESGAFKRYPITTMDIQLTPGANQLAAKKHVLALLAMLGYSLNTISLFALILAIGIVVDDAIVIVENVERLRKLHPEMDIKQIVSLTMHEVFGQINELITE